jgi:hypothetical protein
MPIPATATLKNGHYILDPQPGQPPTAPFYACNCGSTPANRTVRHIAANRHLYSQWPLPAKPPEQLDADKTV